MTSHRYIPKKRRAVPGPPRLRAWIALLLMLGMAIGQAWHSHGERLAPSAHHAEAQVASPGIDADICPLCVAMHSAVPSAMHWSAEPVRFNVVSVTAEVPAPVPAPPGHAHFSRPPPQLS